MCHAVARLDLREALGERGTKHDASGGPLEKLYAEHLEVTRRHSPMAFPPLFSQSCHVASRFEEEGQQAPLVALNGRDFPAPAVVLAEIPELVVTEGLHAQVLKLWGIAYPVIGTWAYN